MTGERFVHPRYGSPPSFRLAIGAEGWFECGGSTRVDGRLRRDDARTLVDWLTYRVAGAQEPYSSWGTQPPAAYAADSEVGGRYLDADAVVARWRVVAPNFPPECSPPTLRRE